MNLARPHRTAMARSSNGIIVTAPARSKKICPSHVNIRNDRRDQRRGGTAANSDGSCCCKYFIGSLCFSQMRSQGGKGV
jgi:hypothetical protein